MRLERARAVDDRLEPHRYEVRRPATHAAVRAVVVRMGKRARIDTETASAIQTRPA